VCGIVLDLLSSLRDATELHLGIHDTLKDMLLMECLGEVSLRYALEVVMGIIVSIPPCACSVVELVGSNSHAILISVGGEVQLLLDLAQRVLSGDGVVISTVKSRNPQLEEALQLPLKVIEQTSRAT